jgi:hypothetical protein
MGMMMSKTMYCLFLISMSFNSSGNEPILVDAAGRGIGYFVGIGPSICAFNYDYAVISKTGYLACITSSPAESDQAIYPPGLNSGINNTAYFLTSNCSGQEYLQVNGDANGGYVIMDSNQQLVMVLTGVSSTGTKFPNSKGFAGNCMSLFEAGSIDGTPALHNDPVVTGIFVGPYKTPLTIQVTSDGILNDEIYFDGFRT